MRELGEVLRENREVYIEALKRLLAIDTHDIGHGIQGGLEREGQEYMAELLSSMGAEVVRDDFFLFHMIFPLFYVYCFCFII